MDDRETAAGAAYDELRCAAYRSGISPGIRVRPEFTVIGFKCANDGEPGCFSAPSVIVFDSADGLEHDNYPDIEAFHYLEYGEVWFDGHSILTNARNMKVERIEPNTPEACQPYDYRIETGRYRDHMIIRMFGPDKKVETIIALPDSSKSAYISLTGEHCIISGITVEKTGKSLDENDIPRISDEISYIDRMTGDVPNVQIDGARTAISKGLRVKDGMKLKFHGMSLPASKLVQHCPYIVLYSSAGGKTDGDDYQEYALIRLNGESGENGKGTQEELEVAYTSSFAGWDAWKEKLREGFECEVRFTRRDKKLTLTTENMGVSIRSTIVLSDKHAPVYVAITGDQCAVTDIWASYSILE
ncbi:MAG: hypothetical protein K6E62_10175 [Lachnospiraceae bacterium]|nr:hypothetical protein [Lachnospiraceae bacterium]